jgi:hypothetical protein
MVGLGDVDERVEVRVGGRIGHRPKLGLTR